MRFLTQGLLSKAEVLRYLQPIVECWDELLPQVKAVWRFRSILSLLKFTDQFRERVKKVTPWGDRAEAQMT